MLKPGYILSNRYKVVSILGQGGQSNVYLLKDTRLKNKMWVAKEMSAQYTDPHAQSLAKKHFEQEANMLAVLDHPNLPKVIDYFSQGGKYYLIMKYLEGEDLSQKLKKAVKPFSEEQVALWFEQVAKVLYYLHCQPHPIIFRDIKPSNIMIVKGKVKLIDFGIARHFNPAKQGDTLRIGSPGYSPPEQYSGQTDPRSDIYSVGVAMHHLLTLQDPSTASTPFKLPPVKLFNKDVSSKMVYIIEKATQIEPLKRYQNALELKKDLREIIDAKKALKNTKPSASPAGVTVPHIPAGFDKTVLTPPPINAAIVQPSPQVIVNSETAANVTDTEKTALSSKKDFISSLTAEGEKETAPVESIEEPASEEKQKKSPFLGFFEKIILLFLLAGIFYLSFYLYSNFDTLQKLIPEKSIDVIETAQYISAFEKGKQLLDEGSYRQALIELLKAERENPGDLAVYEQISRVYCRLTGTPSHILGVITFDSSEDKKQSSSDSFSYNKDEYLTGVLLAARQINYNGGINGKSIDIIHCVLSQDEEENQRKADELFSSQPLAVLVLGNSPPQWIIHKAEINGAIIISDVKPLDENDYSGLFHYYIPLQEQMEVFAAFLKKYEIHNAIVVYDADNHQDTFELLEKYTNENSIIIEKAFSYKRDNPNFHQTIEEIEKLSLNDLKGIIFLGDENTAAYFTTSLRKRRLKTTVFLPPFLHPEYIFPKGGESLEYFDNITGIRPFYSSIPSYNGEYFSYNFEKSFDRKPTQKSAKSYDLVNLIIQAAGSSFPEPEKIKAYLIQRDTGSFYQGITGIMGKNTTKAPLHWAVIHMSKSGWEEAGGFQR